MPEFIVKTYAPRDAPSLATRRVGEAEVAADQAKPTDYRRARQQQELPYPSRPLPARSVLRGRR